MSEEQELPEGWIKAQLGSFADIIGGSTPSRAEPRYFGGNIVWLTPTEIPKGTVSVVSDSREKLTEDGFNKGGVRWIPKESVLLTSRASIGYVAIAGTDLTTNQGFASFILPNDIAPKYLGWWLKSQKNLLEELAGGTTFKEISKTTLREIFAPLAPLPEQQRIVSALEERFTILDAVTTALQQNKQKLKRARASVLKYAVEGKLTEKWRAEHPATESGSQLLERILTERRAKWEAEQVAKGKDPRKLRYEEPAGPDVSGLPELPEGWCWTTIGQIAWSVKDGPHYSPKYVEDGIPFITGGNIKPTGVDFVSAKRISLELHVELSKRCKPEKGDILYTKGGTTGIARVNTYDIDFNVWVHVAVLKLINSINVFHIQNTLNSQLCYVQAQKFTHGVGNQDLGLTRMIHIVLPFPPLAEQHQIVAEVERRLSVIEQAQVAIETSLKRIERARQSILERAFSGRLVSQDPHDEPASVLLERIQQERARRVVDGKQRSRNGGIKAARGRKMQEQDFVPQWQLLQDAKQSGSVDGLLGNAGAREDGVTENSEIGPDKIDKEELRDLVQMPLLSLWD